MCYIKMYTNPIPCLTISIHNLPDRHLNQTKVFTKTTSNYQLMFFKGLSSKFWVTLHLKKKRSIPDSQRYPCKLNLINTMEDSDSILIISPMHWNHTWKLTVFRKKNIDTKLIIDQKNSYKQCKKTCTPLLRNKPHCREISHPL